jgi:hypothetical protein
MKQQRIMSEQDVVDALKFGKELPQLKDQFLLLVEEIDNLEYKKNNSKTVLSALQNQISTTKDSLKIYQSAVDEKIQNIAEAHKKLAQLENIKSNSKNYQKIERIAEQKANDILNNKKVVILAAVISVLDALRNHPDKQQLLIYDLFYNNHYPTNNDDITLYTTKMISSAPNPENYLPLPFHHKEILKIADGLYDNLLKAVVDNTIYTPLQTTQI